MGITKHFYTLEQIRKDDLLEKSGNEMATTELQLICHTKKAILIHAKVVMVKMTCWLPKSQVLKPDPIALNLVKTGDELTLVIPLWLIKTNGLTYEEFKYDK